MISNDLTPPISCPTGWGLVRLKDISKKIGSGATPIGGQAAYQAKRTNYALIRSQNVFDRSFSEAGLAFISDEQAQGLRNVKLEEDDLLLNITGDGITFGRTCTVPARILPACVNQHVAIIRVDRDYVHPGYLLAFLTHPQVKEYIEGFNAGGSRRAITKAHIESFVVPLPPMPFQIDIASMLKALDDRIVLLRETNITLEAITQSLFKSWFVDFDPVRAKLDGRVPEGMDEATAALFPDSFDESEIGLVPTGWRVGEIGDVVNYVGGGTPSTKDAEYWEPGEHAWTTPKDLSGLQSPALLRTERQISSKGLTKVSSGLLPAGTLLLSSRAPIGYLAITQIPLAINQGYIAILPSSQLPPLYMLFWCQQNMEVIKSRANGSTFMEISKKAFSPIPLLVPPAPVLHAFMIIASQLFSRLVENEKQAQTLVCLRDTLLPRLISGQLRLPEVGTVLEKAAA